MSELLSFMALPCCLKWKDMGAIARHLDLERLDERHLRIGQPFIAASVQSRGPRFTRWCAP
jgi:hypothetical protein